MKLVFFGTPDFSETCLQALLNAGHTVCSVFTQPDKPKGRKMELCPSPVKVLAQKYNLPVYQPNSLRDGWAESFLSQEEYDVFVVVAYGKIFPKELLRLPKYGCVNLHASLLPKYRGASPIQAAILNGEEVTGVTTQKMDEGIDTGDILLQATTPILPSDNGERLFDRLSVLGAEVLLQTLQGLEQGSIIPAPQNHDLATHSGIISKEMGKIDFQKNATQIFNQIRAFDPWPSAFFSFGGKHIKVTLAQTVAGNGIPGEILQSKGKLVVACGENTAIELLRLKPEGKKEMPAVDFLNGNPLTKGTMLCD